jgi:IclR family acetate operon transcriptional repressor
VSLQIQNRPRRGRQPMVALTRVLGALAEMDDPAIGLRELARRLSTAPSSLQRTLEAAEDTCLIVPSESGGWELGWELYRIAAIAHRKRPFQAAAGVLDRLREDTGETALLSVYDPRRAARMFVAAAQSRHSVRFVPTLFGWMPVHAGAGAHAVLAFRPEAERRAAVARSVLAFPDTPTMPLDRLEGVWADGRRRGTSTSVDEVNVGASAVAAPVRTGPHSTITTSIVVIAPSRRFDAVPAAELAARVATAAEQLGPRLGHVHPVVPSGVIDRAARPTRPAGLSRGHGRRRGVSARGPGS